MTKTPMLSRVADSLFWMARYLERAEHTARLLDVHLHSALDLTPAAAERRWRRLLAALHGPLAAQSVSPYAITQAYTFDTTTSDSIMACVTAARENARQVRERISSEMWEQVNRLYLYLRTTSMDEMWSGEPHLFFRAVKEGVHLFQGITDATLSHDEGWWFIQIGRYLERAMATAALLDVHFGALDASDAASLDYFEWVSLLKSCTAFEAYCKVYTASVHPEDVAEFLLLNAEFPRSIRFAADMIQEAAQVIGRSSVPRATARVERLAGRLRAALDYGQVDEIMMDMHTYLMTIRRMCAQVHDALYQACISYSADEALR
ncbi:alpha-E domain-containing protein [Roseiflexus castenholzii]|jgi:uncharacterized alpha-E superfamily protein|uniref:DUF403 domain-containing protein n=1 Tax=Roseiflexus castenholzii (strain DSM 13941 / HLO8) TaxID=383372 RepID=A7NQF3_ROSCS|nr:alpha-E domain-containing protein [Roseiflexus castenholzii]ABU59799.1 protein of unknown function DUF403 [Roseiflexus castenholzii DSM 13941]